MGIQRGILASFIRKVWMYMVTTQLTVLQDNEAAIQIAINRGALSKQSRHVDRRVLASRNKIEDGEVIPKY